VYPNPRRTILVGHWSGEEQGLNGSRAFVADHPEVVVLPRVADSAAFQAWLPQARGKWVLTSFPQPTCRPDENWVKWGTPESVRRLAQTRDSARAEWDARVRNTGLAANVLPRRLEDAGALGIVTGNWNRGWGVNFTYAQARTLRAPTVDLSCEDYGLVYRLAENGQGPQLRVDADAELQGEVPVFNVFAEIRGRERPNEYVMLSAHFDSWDGASGATDNGTGTVTMMEAMRILKKVYPNPRRTILVGHWSGEEQGLNGSRAFVADHPEVVAGLQALFNQDNGTGRVSNVGMQGFTEAATFFRGWLSRVPEEIRRHIQVQAPGTPSAGGSDHSSFVCAGAPAFMLGSLSWDYGTYTWHTNRDTFDKIAFDDLRNNAVLTAMLAYLASEEPGRVSRARRTDLRNDRGETGVWPACQQPARSAAQSTR
ncbi:MAG TPA: M20/M25/M40 family metallo-hydrolase, partial [Longimicrobiaceae bacterium]|nr:M20/M25/M40 family metallo-hydrolase [Longimicrobiaceae bacterium]